MARGGARGKPTPGPGTLSGKNPTSFATGASTNPVGFFVTPDQKHLYCGLSGTQQLGVFIIGAGGALSAGTHKYSDYTTTYVTGSSNGAHIYCINSGGNTLSCFSRNSTTGVLTDLSPKNLTTGTLPNGICIAPDDAFVYVTCKTPGTLLAFSRNTSTGVLTAAGTPSYTVGTSPMGVLISSDGLFLYCVNGGGTISQFSRNTSTGALTPLSPATVATGTTPSIIVLSPSTGTHLYVANDVSSSIGMYARDVSTGLLSALSPASVPAGNGPWCLAMAPNGLSVYCAASDGQYIVQYSRDNSTGLLAAKTPLYVRSDTNATTTSQGNGPQALGIAPDGLSLYCSNTQPSFSIGMFDIHP